jgi:predicted MFS family arabinose efflux permease
LLLCAINFLNYIDRYLLSACLPLIKQEFRLSDARLGALVTAFMTFYTISAPVAGLLADRYMRNRILSGSIALWSFATVATGRAGSYLTLFVTRALVGVGESGYSTISPVFLSDVFPKDHRGRALAWFYIALPGGAALGYLLGGILSAHFGWRNTFYAGGVPGLVLAALMLGVREPRRGETDLNNSRLPANVDAQPPRLSARRYADLLRNRSFVLITLSMAAFTFALGGVSFWMPTFLSRIRGIPLATANVQFGAMTAICGSLGSFAGGYLGDFFLRYWRSAYLIVSAAGLLLAVPASLIGLLATNPTYFLVALAFAEFLLFLNYGPLHAAMINCVHPAIRNTALAVNVVILHLLGDALSAWALGAISDVSRLDRAMLVAPPFIVVSAIILLFCIPSLPRDIARVEAQLRAEVSQ